MTWSLSSPAKAASTAYRVGPGETVEINISSIPDHNLRAVVQADGTIVIADVGSIMIAGLTPTEMQTRLETVLPTKLFHARTSDGKMQTYIIAPSDITSGVVTYGPVYVTGAVFNPGEMPYRPQLTTQQAIAVSGGPSLIRGRAPQGGGDPVDLQRDYQSLWTEYLKAHYHRERIMAEMKGVAEFDLRAPAGTPLPEKLASTIGNSETEALKLALEDRRREQAYLEAGAKGASEQIDVLSEREKVEAAAEKGDQQDLAKVTQLLKNGNLTNDRVSEIRRSLLITSSRRLETLVELMRERNRRSDTERKIEQSQNQRKTKLLDDLRDTSVLLVDLDVRLQATGSKLQMHDVGTRVEPSIDKLSQPKMTIMRKVDGQWQKLPADMETELLPGDVLEVLPAVATEQSSASVPVTQNKLASDMRSDNKISMN